MLSTEQLSPAPSIHHNQLMSYSENLDQVYPTKPNQTKGHHNQLVSYSDNFSEQVYPTPHSPLPEELILQKPPTGPSTSWFQQ